MNISPEQAKEEIEKVLKIYSTIGDGTEQDRAAQLILQTTDVLSKRLDNTKVIKMLYLDNVEASKLLPETVFKTATDLVNGDINKGQAEQNLKEAREAYQQAFKQMEINPSDSNVLFSK